MNDKTLDLLRSKASLRQQRTTPPSPAADEEQCRAFGYLRGIGDQARSLELRFANGNREAFPYSWLGPAKYNPSAGILMKFVGDLVYLVVIEGSNLNTLMNNAISLYERGILRHRITWVREMARQELENAGEGEAIVERIHMTCCRPDEEPKGVQWLEPFREQG
jgi:hypothetical protein